MRPNFKPDTHKESALYWSAVGLMVCEGCSVEEAASQLGVHDEDLRTILQRRSTNSPFDNFTSSYMDRRSRRDLS